MSQTLVIHTARQYPTVRRPMDGAIAMAALTVHRSLKGFGDPLLFLEPPFLLVPCYDFSSSFGIEWQPADRTRTTVEPTDTDGCGFSFTHMDQPLSYRITRGSAQRSELSCVAAQAVTHSPTNPSTGSTNLPTAQDSYVSSNEWLGRRK